MTYLEIKEVLDKMSSEQLSQKAQIMLPCFSDGPFRLDSVIGFNTAHHYVCAPNSDEELVETRSSVDNKHHPDNFVFLCDYNPYDLDGAIGFDLLTGERIFSERGGYDSNLAKEDK